MPHYMISFIVYIFAMSGLIALAMLIYKKVMNVSSVKNKAKMLSIEETMSINPRKTLLIVRAGNERFLIASDVDKTSLIAKLGQNEDLNEKSEIIKETKVPQSRVIDLQKVKNAIDKENVDILFPKKATKQSSKPQSPSPKSTGQKQLSKNTEKPVHFEVINQKNPNAPERNRQHSYTVNRRRNVTLEVGAVKNHGLSTIKEILHKVNEL